VLVVLELLMRDTDTSPAEGPGLVWTRILLSTFGRGSGAVGGAAAGAGTGGREGGREVMAGETRSLFAQVIRTFARVRGFVDTGHSDGGPTREETRLESSVMQDLWATATLIQ
jgi:hypothetical protein